MERARERDGGQQIEVKFVSDLCLIIFLLLCWLPLVFVLMFLAQIAVSSLISSRLYPVCECVWLCALARHQMYFHFHIKCVFLECFISSTEKIMCIFCRCENQPRLDHVLCISSYYFFLPSFHPVFLVVFVLRTLVICMRVAHVRNRREQFRKLSSFPNCKCWAKVESNVSSNLRLPSFTSKRFTEETIMFEANGIERECRGRNQVREQQTEREREGERTNA